LEEEEEDEILRWKKMKTEPADEDPGDHCGDGLEEPLVPCSQDQAFEAPVGAGATLPTISESDCDCWADPDMVASRAILSSDLEKEICLGKDFEPGNWDVVSTHHRIAYLRRFLLGALANPFPLLFLPSSGLW
jgi:hypothetical protein